jgi:hypothetical protein
VEQDNHRTGADVVQCEQHRQSLLDEAWRECMGIEPTRSLFPDPSPVLKTGAGTSRTRTPKAVIVRAYVNCVSRNWESNWSKVSPNYFSETGGTPKYYGKVSKVSQRAAEEKFSA